MSMQKKKILAYYFLNIFMNTKYFKCRVEMEVFARKTNIIIIIIYTYIYIFEGFWE
jgi:hypothetical protein